MKKLKNDIGAILQNLFEKTRLYENLGHTTTEFKRIIQEKTTTLYSFILAAANLYGVITIDGLIEILNYYQVDFLSHSFLLELINAIAFNKTIKVMSFKDNIITNRFFNFNTLKNEQTIKNLLQDQQKISRYLPTKKEFLLYKSAYYNDLSSKFNDFKNLLVSTGFFAHLTEAEILNKIEAEILNIKLGRDPLLFLNTIIDSLDEVLSIKKINELSTNFVNLISAIRHYHLNGYTLEELEAKNKNLN